MLIKQDIFLIWILDFSNFSAFSVHHRVQSAIIPNLRLSTTIVILNSKIHQIQNAPNIAYQVITHLSICRSGTYRQVWWFLFFVPAFWWLMRVRETRTPNSPLQSFYPDRVRYCSLVSLQNSSGSPLALLGIQFKIVVSLTRS